MILVTGIPTEPPVQLVTEAAENAGIPYILFNQRYAHLYELSVNFKGNTFTGVLQVNGQDYNLEEIAGVYVRMMDHNFLPELKNKVYNYIGEQPARKSLLVHTHFVQWLEIATCRIFNRPWDMLSNFSKPYQAQMIAAAGFKIPPTCITSDVNILNNFRKKHPGLIFKSISSARSIVKELDELNIHELEKIRYLPTQFQEKLQGVNIRVHVVGDVLFATMAISKVVDYRYAGRDGEDLDLVPFQLPAEIEKRCFEVAKSLHLLLCGIDLFLTDDGDYYCFEVNPSPGYSFYQQNTGQDISSAIVKWLEYGTAK